MFEYDKYEAKRHLQRPASPAEAYAPLPGIRRVSFLMWGEHCIECAAPACYSTCDLYDARPDKRCRRFEYGFYRNRRFRSARGSGAEVLFRKWGKIEARGNLLMMPVWQVRWLERMIAALAPLSNTLGRLPGRITGDIRWNYATYALVERLVYRLRKRRSEAKPDGFLAEIYNPAATSVTLQLVMSIDKSHLQPGISSDQLPRTYAEKLALAPGYSRTFVPFAKFEHIADSKLPFNITLLPQADERTHLILVGLDFVALSSAARESQLNDASKADRPAAKCVILDLDHTLWEGILLEDENVALRPGIKNLIQTLDRRGILWSIASKNAHEHAWAKLTEFGLSEYFLFPKINWMPKSRNVARIARDLNIGLDACIFIDDNEFELQEVRRALPEVECIHVSQLANLAGNPRLQGSASAEAGARRQLYQESMVRQQVEEGFDGDYIAFLRSCNITLDVEPYSPARLERVAELVQRTNQLNFSGRKYDRDHIQRILDDAEYDKWMIECKDKIGSYGTVGFCLSRVDGNVVKIDDFMLSCRVQGKFIEQALFAFLVKWYSSRNVTQLWINFCQTDRNAPAKLVLDKLGFNPGATSGLECSIGSSSFSCDFIECRSPRQAW